MPKKDKSTEENQSACDPENVEQLTKDMVRLSRHLAWLGLAKHFLLVPKNFSAIQKKLTKQPKNG
jgi:hypothetical protein